MFTRSLQVAALALALAPAAVACGGEDAADATESGEGAASAGAKAVTMNCAWEENPSDFIRAMLEGSSYELELSEAKGKGTRTGDPKPDNWKFEKVEGKNRLYIGGKIEMPATVTLGGQWSVVLGLTVPKGMVDGEEGTMTISSYVKEGSKLTPLAKSDRKETIDALDEPNVMNSAEVIIQRTLLKEQATAVMKAKCKAASAE